MLIAIVPMLVMIAGLVLYLVATRAEVKECGRLAFGCGLLVLVWILGGHTVRLG